jgi:4-amino-4-deoxychorismate lyase
MELSRDGEFKFTATPFVLQAPNSVWKLRIAEAKTTSTDPLIHHKTTRRELYDAARKEFATTEADEVILLNEKGEIAEGTITNIFVDDGVGRFLTPPLSSGCLAGILRTSLICARKAVNQRLRPEDLTGKTLYVGNSLRGLIRAELK